MTDRVRFGVVGTGPWAHLVHVPAAASSPRVRLAAVYGRDLERARGLASRTEAEPLDDLDAFLDAVDVVGFAVPPDAQPALADRALRAGKHVLLEKPVSLDVDAADALVALADAQALRSLVFFTHRFMPELVRWTDAAAAAGPWARAHLESYSSLLLDPGNPFAASPWRRERGALWDIGPHAIARLCAVLGPVVEVAARRGAGDHVVLTLGHASGAVATVSLASDLPEPPPGGFRLTGPDGRTATAPGVADWTAASRGAYRAAIAQLVDEIDGAPAGACDLAFGAQVTRVLAAAELSAADSGVARVP